jgi:hypothetical protein
VNTDDPLQHSIRRTTGQHALKKIRAIVDEENRNDAAVAVALHRLLRYGWIALLVVAVLIAHLIGVY